MADVAVRDAVFSLFGVNIMLKATVIASATALAFLALSSAVSVAQSPRAALEDGVASYVRGFLLAPDPHA